MVGVVISSIYQPDRIQDHLGDSSLGMAVGLS